MKRSGFVALGLVALSPFVEVNVLSKVGHGNPDLGITFTAGATIAL